ncbi:hypothetical protein CR513_22321, partial [Mucuna pruriens]
MEEKWLATMQKELRFCSSSNTRHNKTTTYHYSTKGVASVPYGCQFSLPKSSCMFKFMRKKLGVCSLQDKEEC